MLATAPAALLFPPSNYKEIVATFGNLTEYIRHDGTLDPRWEREFMAHARLPFAIPLAGAPGELVTRIYCHRKLAGIFGEVFVAIQERHLQQSVISYGGCFHFRRKRTAKRKFSTHCWGIAIDINPQSNAQGTAGDMDPALVEVFREFGFQWGGHWARRAQDPMHFQFCTGY
jgi:hypothetical protein